MSTKETVLNTLSAANGNAVSGQELAALCGVSRAAVWKAVKTLRDEGCSIEGTTNGGYVLLGQADIFTTEAVEACFRENFPSLSGCHIETFREIDSTNTYAKRLLAENGSLRNRDGSLSEAGKKLHQSVIIAECQTAGRGRLGRTFVSPARTGIYISVIYAPAGGITEPARLTALSAVAVCRAVKKLFGIQASIKWINDIFINGKKICGILTEGSTNFETGTIESAVIGIGINIKDNPEVFGGELSDVAGSITGATDGAVSRAELGAEVAGQTLLILEEDVEKAMAEYKQLSFLIGKTVTVHPVIGDDKSVYQARVTDILSDASLKVQLSDGNEKVLSSGEVSLRSTQLTNP